MLRKLRNGDVLKASATKKYIAATAEPGQTTKAGATGGRQKAEESDRREKRRLLTECAQSLSYQKIHCGYGRTGTGNQSRRESRDGRKTESRREREKGKERSSDRKQKRAREGKRGERDKGKEGKWGRQPQPAPQKGSGRGE